MTKDKNRESGSNSSLSQYHRIVAKLGTGLLTGGSDHLNEDIISSLVGQIA